MTLLLPLLLLQPAAPPTVAVLPLEKGAGSDEYTGLGKALAGMITTDLSSVEDLQLVERDRLNEIMAEIKLSKTGFLNKKTAQKLGKGIGARFLVTGSYSVVKAKFLMDARVIAVQSGKVVKAANANGTVEDFVAVEKDLVEHLLDGLSVKISSSTRRKMIVQTPTESFKAFSAYGEGLHHSDEGQADKAKKAFQRALKLDPKFAEAKKALSSLSSLLASERMKDRQRDQKASSAFTAAIFETYKDERKRKKSFKDDRDSLIGFSLRLVTLENEGMFCQRYEEMLHFLDRRRWKYPEIDRKFWRDAEKVGKKYGYKKMKERKDARHLDSDLDDRVRFTMESMATFVGGRWIRQPWLYGQSMIDMVKRCYPPARQLKVLKQLRRKAKKNGVLESKGKYDTFDVGDLFDLNWAWIQAQNFGASAEVEKITRRLIAKHKNGDKDREKVLKLLDDITKDARTWSEHQSARLGKSEDEIRRMMFGIVKKDPKVVKLKTRECKAVFRMTKAMSKSWVSTMKKQANAHYLSQQQYYDQAGMYFSPMLDMGCIVGEPGRFSSTKQVLDYLKNIKKHTRKGASEIEACDTAISQLDIYDWDMMYQSVESSPANAANMAYGFLISRYNLLKAECVKD